MLLVFPRVEILSGSRKAGPAKRIVQVKYTNQNKALKRTSSELWESKHLLTSGRALLFLDQIKREKGVWWMPWQ